MSIERMLSRLKGARNPDFVVNITQAPDYDTAR